MGQNKEPRSKPVRIWPNDFQQGCQDYTEGKGHSLQRMVLLKLDTHTQKSEFRLIPYTIHKN